MRVLLSPKKAVSEPNPPNTAEKASNWTRNFIESLRVKHEEILKLANEQEKAESSEDVELNFCNCS